jgi:hypothetical protein
VRWLRTLLRSAPASIATVDNGSALTAILLWLSPILGPLFGVFVLVVVLPLVVGAIAALVALVVRSVHGFAPRRDGHEDHVASPVDDPWSSLTALAESPRDPEDVKRRSGSSPR